MLPLPKRRRKPSSRRPSSFRLGSAITPPCVVSISPCPAIIPPAGWSSSSPTSIWPLCASRTPVMAPSPTPSSCSSPSSFSCIPGLSCPPPSGSARLSTTTSPSGSCAACNPPAPNSTPFATASSLSWTPGTNNCSPGPSSRTSPRRHAPVSTAPSWPPLASRHRLLSPRSVARRLRLLRLVVWVDRSRDEDEPAAMPDDVLVWVVLSLLVGLWLLRWGIQALLQGHLPAWLPRSGARTPQGSRTP